MWLLSNEKGDVKLGFIGNLSWGAGWDNERWRTGRDTAQEVSAVVWQSEGCRFDPTLGVSKCPWARRLTLNCSWRTGWCLAWQQLAVGVNGWMRSIHCTALWKKALYKWLYKGWLGRHTQKGSGNRHNKPPRRGSPCSLPMRRVNNNKHRELINKQDKSAIYCKII